MRGRLELIKEPRGYAPANQGRSPTQSGVVYGRAKPFLTSDGTAAATELDLVATLPLCVVSAQRVFPAKPTER
jgi:hypothetical protein